MTVKQAMVKLKVAGVKNLREFGYPGVDINNIMTDPIYTALFSNLLLQTEFLLPKFPMYAENIVPITIYRSAIKVLQRKIKNNIS